MPQEREYPPFKESLQPVSVGLEEDPEQFWYLSSQPNKLVRATNHYFSVEEALPNIRFQRKELELVKERYGIQYVDYQVILGNKTEQGVLTTYVVADKIPDAVGFEEIIEHEIPAQHAVEIGEEFDLVASKLTLHLRDIASHGGVLAREFPRLDQFAYVPSMPRGERCVFLDVDPLFSYVLRGFEGRPRDRRSCTIITDTLLGLVLQTMELEQKLDRTSLAREDLRALLEDIPDNVGPAITRMKRDILHALETNDPSGLIAAEQQDDEDEMKSGYWYLFMMQAQLPPMVEVFPDDESIRQYIDGLGE